MEKLHRIQRGKSFNSEFKIMRNLRIQPRPMPPTQQIRPYEGIINHHCPLDLIRVLFQWWGGIGGGGYPCI